MQWYYILIIVLSLLASAYTLFCIIVAPKFLADVATPKVRTYDDSRKFQMEQEHWDFNDFDNVWKKTPFEIVTFDGLKLLGLHVENPKNTNPKKVAIICHGHVGNHIQSVKYADIFYKKGFDIILYDNRYFGNSEGLYCTLGQNETKDISKIIDKTKEICGDDCYIVLHGESMGGATVLSVLETREKDIQYVIADCPFSNSVKMFRQTIRSRVHLPSFPLIDIVCIFAKAKYDYDARSVKPINVVKNTNTPICFIHGTKDWLILPHHSEDMYKACKNPLSELHLFPDAHHARSHMKDKDAYIKIVSDFVDKMDSLQYTTK